MVEFLNLLDLGTKLLWKRALVWLLVITEGTRKELKSKWYLFSIASCNDLEFWTLFAVQNVKANERKLWIHAENIVFLMNLRVVHSKNCSKSTAIPRFPSVTVIFWFLFSPCTVNNGSVDYRYWIGPQSTNVGEIVNSKFTPTERISRDLK